MKRALMVGAMIVIFCLGGATHGAQLTPTLSERTLQLMQQWIQEAQKFLNSTGSDMSGKTPTLIDLLDRGNRIMDLALRDTNGAQGVGEGFGEVYHTIFAALWNNGDRNDQRVLDVLVRGSYNPDSPFALEVARNYGERIAPTLLELVQSDFFVDRMTTAEMLGTLLQNANLQSTTRDRIHSAMINAAASDENPAVRIWAVTTIGKVGTPVDLTILQRIAANDPEAKTARDGVRYPVREAAQRAVREIQKR
jgi:hypothetical protein